MKRILKITLNTLYKTLIALVLVLGILLLTLQIPSVQTAILEKITTQLSEKSGYQHSATRLTIKWPDAISLENVLIKDKNYRPMIEVGRIDINHNFWNIIKGVFTKKLDLSKGLYLDEAMLYRPFVWIIFDKKTGKLNINEWIDALAQMTPPDTTKAPSGSVPFGVKKIRIIDGIYRMDDPRKSQMKGRDSFDHNHFYVTKINGTANNLYSLGDTLMIDVRNLTATEKNTRLTVKGLDTRFFMCDHKMELGDLRLRINGSSMQNYFAMHYDSFKEFDDFNNKVTLKAHLDSARVLSSDLGYFSDYLKTLNETWSGSGNFEGTVQNFKYNGKARFGKNSYVNGRIEMKNALDYQNAVVNFDLNQSRFDAADIRQYYPDKAFNDQMSKLGVIDIPKGKFAGRFDNFTANGDYHTALGNVSGTLKLDLRPTVPVYDLNATTQNFDLGALINDPTVGKISLDGKLKGRGFSLKDASFGISTLVPRVAYNGYEYRNVHLTGNYQKNLFEGAVVVRDSNLKASVDGLFDFSSPTYAYAAHGRIEKADLRALKFLKDSLVLHTDLEIDMRGNKIDELTGTGKFLNSYAIMNKRNLVVDSLEIRSQLSAANERQLDILSEFLNFKAVGQFKPTQVVSDLTQLFVEYQMAFVGDETTRQNYYVEKNNNNKLPQARYSMDYTIGFKKMDKLLAFLYPEGHISGASKAEGNFTMDKTSMLTFEGYFDTLYIDQKNHFYKTNIDLNSSKFGNNPEVLASVNIVSKEQQLSGLSATEKLDIEASWENDHIEFRSKIKQKDKSNRATFNGDLRFRGNAMVLQFKKSKLQLLENEWSMASNNLVLISGANVLFNNLSMNNGEQRIAINGSISTDSLQQLKVEANKVELASFNPILATKMSGLVNGKVYIKDFYGSPIYESNLTVDKFNYNAQDIGDLLAKADWNSANQYLDVNAYLIKDKQKAIGITGIIDPKSDDNALDLVARFNNSDLKSLNAFTEGLISDISGKAVGEVKVKGAFANPKFDGIVNVQKGRLTFDYLKAIFAFEDKIYFDEQEIRVKNLKLTDPEGNVATLRGGVFYDGFENYSMNFDAQLRNFKILNTTLDDNAMFYGTAYATGKFEMWGPISNLNIKPTLTANRGTKIYIPLDGASDVATQDFVQFVAPVSVQKDTVLAAAQLVVQETNDANFRLDMQLNMTPDASVEIQLDRQSGHGINAYGSGLLNMGYDTRNELFTMAGNYEVKNGIYNYSFANVINKQLQIQPGGRMSWTGDPYGATLDLTANYTARAFLKPIITSSVESDAALNLRYPIDVTMKITDQLIKPQLQYDIKFKEFPSKYSLDISAMETSFKRDEQYMFSQLVSLMAFNQLIPTTSSFLLASGNSVNNLLTNNAAELIGNQVSKLGSSIDPNLELGVSTGGINASQGGLNAFRNDLWNNLQLRFSYRFFNGRFSVTRDGRLSYGNNSSDASNLLLDWTIEYWVTPDGNKRVKMYNRNLQNQLSLASSGSAAYGISFVISHSFNHFYELTGEPEKKVKSPKKSGNDLTLND